MNAPKKWLMLLLIVIILLVTGCAIKDRLGEEKSTENPNGGWNSTSGILISGPAEIRKEALAKANF